MDIRSLEGFLSYFDRIRGRTRRVIECIPPDRIEWTHRDGAFTFGDLIRHLAAMERYMFAENVAGRPSRYPGHGRSLADGYDAVIALLDRLHAESMEIFRSVGDAGLDAYVVSPGGAGARMRAWKWLRAMVEHEVHHRGQLYLMLGTLGVATPPLYGLTSEEVRARSESLEA